MSITAKFYNFSKGRKTSLLPTVGSDIPIDIKNGCSVTNPLIELSYEGKPPFNYFYIPDFGRYYYVTGMDFVEGLWLVSGKVDVLNSFRSSILATRANILYSSSSSKNMIDTRIPLVSGYHLGHNDVIVSAGQHQNLFTGNRVIVSLTGAGSSGPYALNHNSDLYEMLDGIDNWGNSGVFNTVEGGLKQLVYGGGAAQCLKNAIAIPVSLDPEEMSDADSAEDLYLGGYPCAKSGGTLIKGWPISLSTRIIKTVTDVPIPWYHSDWRRNSPYTQIHLYLPYIGSVVINPVEILDKTSIKVTYSINVTNGDLSCQWGVADDGVLDAGRVIGQATSNIAIALPFGNTGIDTKAFLGGSAALMGSAAMAAALGPTMSAGAALGVFGGMAKGAADMIGMLGGTSDGSGTISGSGAAGLERHIHIWVISKDISDSQANLSPIMGKPYFGAGTLTNHRGYVQTEHFNCKDSNAYETEIAEINSLLDGGIYIE